jgi:hypothetical protein
MEERLGADFRDVRLHLDAPAAKSASEVHARAYTVGDHIVFSQGAFAPDTTEGQRLLVHELVHTLQQKKAGHVSPGLIPAAHPLEREADRIAASVLNSGDSSARTQTVEVPIRSLTKMPVIACARQVAETVPETSEDTEAVVPSSDGATQLSASSGGGGDGTPGPNIPDCSAWMGGRQVEHWFAGSIMGANHTYINFKEDASHYWLVEAGPLPGDPHHVGAWAKAGQWENRGIRIGTQYNSPEVCASAKAALFSAQSTYHSMVLLYDPTAGPNSNSFTEHMTYKAPVFGLFMPFDWKWNYWRSHTRPF